MSERDSSSEWGRLTEATQVESLKAEAARHSPSPAEYRGSRVLPVALLVSLAALGGGWLGPLNPWPSAPSEEQLDEGYRASLMLAAQAIHDYSVINQGRYPKRLDDALALRLNDEIEYVPLAEGFELRIKKHDGTPIVLRSR